MSECCLDNCNAKFACHVVYTNLKNEDRGVTVVSKFTGKSSHPPFRRAMDDDILHASPKIDTGFHNFHIMRVGDMDYRLRTNSVKEDIANLNDEYIQFNIICNGIRLKGSDTVSEEYFNYCYSKLGGRTLSPIVKCIINYIHDNYVIHDDSLCLYGNKKDIFSSQSVCMNDIPSHSTRKNVKRNCNFAHMYGYLELVESELIPTSYLEDFSRVKSLTTQKMLELKNYCVLSYYSVRKNKMNYIDENDKTTVLVLYAKCKHEYYNKYVFRFLRDTANKYSLEIRSVKVGSHHGLFHGIYLTGFKRSSVQEELCHKTPTMVRRDTILKANSEIIKAGNLTNVHSVKALQHARSEILSKNDMHSDDVADVILRCRHERISSSLADIYVHHARDPLGCLFFSIKHYHSIQSVINRQSLVLHFDATGSVVRKINAKDKRVYYYAGVVNIHGKIVPLLNFVTSEHNIAVINSYLMHFKHCFGQKWPIFRMVVIDFSMAILNAVCEPWNKLSLIDYINLCYKHCKSGETNTNCIVIMLCGSHFQHMISRCINSITKSKRVHDFVLNCIALLIISTDFKTIRGIIRLMFIILLSMKKTIWCAESMNQLNGYCLSVKLKEISLSSNDVGENLVLSTNDHKNVREKSLFYVDFEKIYQNISDRCLLTDSCELLAVNEFHCKLFAKKFLNLYLPYMFVCGLD